MISNVCSLHYENLNLNSNYLLLFTIVYGARPLKRYLEKYITTELSKLIIQTKLGPHSCVTIDSDANDQFLFQIQKLERANSTSPQKPAYHRKREKISYFLSLIILLILIGRRTYEGLDEQPMMDVDNDEDYDNQFSSSDDNKDSSQSFTKRMKQSPMIKK